MAIILLACGPCVVIVNCWDRFCTLGRAPGTKETLPDFHEWCLVTRHPRIFRGLTGCQQDTPVLGRHTLDQPSIHICIVVKFRVFIYLWATSSHTTGSTFDIFTDFHRRRSCLTACEFRTFTLGGGGGADLPQLAHPNTHDFYYYLFLCF